jgi:hypothetical protein
MQHSVLNKQVGIDHTSGVDEDCAVICDRDLQILAVQAGNACVREKSAVSDNAVDNVVLQDPDQISGQEIGGCGGDLLEGFIVWYEDCDFGQLVEGVNEIQFRGSTCQCGEVASDQSIGDALRDQEEIIDDVNDSVIVLDVLLRLVDSVGGAFLTGHSPPQRCSSRVSNLR